MGLYESLCEGNQDELSLPTAESIQKDIASKDNLSQELTPFIPSANPIGFGFSHVCVGLGSDCSTKQRKESIILGTCDS